MSLRFRLCLLTGLVLSLAADASCTTTSAAPPASTPPPPTHHRPAVTATDETRGAASGTDCHLHLDPREGHDAAAAMTALDDAGLAFGWVLSPGYQRAPACGDVECAAQAEWTAEMNDWTLFEAAEHDALHAFCGVRLRAPGAVDEVVRCAARGARGVKLHPVNARQSLLSDDVRRALKDVATAAADHGLIVLIHVPFDPTEVETFFAIARETPAATFVAAHQLGPEAGQLPSAPKNVFVELSGLTMAPAGSCAHFAQLWRAFGTGRVLLGSDWPALSPAAHVDWLRACPLTDGERHKIRADNAARILAPKP